jgi:hypothetical protein
MVVSTATNVPTSSKRSVQEVEAVASGKDTLATRILRPWIREVVKEEPSRLAKAWQ